MESESLPSPKILLPGDNYLLFDVSSASFDLNIQNILTALCNDFLKVIRGIDGFELGINFVCVRYDALVISPVWLARRMKEHWAEATVQNR